MVVSATAVVASATVEMDAAEFASEKIPAACADPELLNYPLEIGGRTWSVTGVNVGNPHCVTFLNAIDGLNLEEIGPMFEQHPLFPERVNTEFVRVVNRSTLRMRVWERGSGETLACGTGACAAAAAAVRLGLCDMNTEITVKLLGGDLLVRVEPGRILLTGNAVLVYEGTFEY